MGGVIVGAISGSARSLDGGFRKGGVVVSSMEGGRAKHRGGYTYARGPCGQNHFSHPPAVILFHGEWVRRRFPAIDLGREADCRRSLIDVYRLPTNPFYRI